MKSALRKALRWANQNLPIRGRYRLTTWAGPMLAPQPVVQPYPIGHFSIEIDHTIPSCLLMYYGLYEENFVNFLRKTLREGDIVLDPGANLGFITAIAADLVGPSGKVFAFEPSVTCFEKLTRLNPAPPPQVELIHAAISDRSGSDTFYDTPRVVSRGYSALGSVSQPADGVPYDIATWSLDDFAARRNIGHIRLIKLDVEGAELPALLGARSILARRQADYILVETTQNNAQRERNRQIAALLSPGYAPFDIRQDGSLKPFDLNGQATYRLDVLWQRKP